MLLVGGLQVVGGVLAGNLWLRWGKPIGGPPPVGLSDWSVRFQARPSQRKTEGSHSGLPRLKPSVHQLPTLAKTVSDAF